MTIVLGIAFPASSALLADDAAHAGQGSGSLLAVNTVGAIVGSLVVPFFLIPVARVAAARRRSSPPSTPSLGIALALAPRRGSVGRLIAGDRRASSRSSVVVAAASAGHPRPAERGVHRSQRAAELFASTEDEIASVQAGQIRFTPELWVAGTSMTLLTVDAKLMPVLPLIARPDSERALVVAFGMGSAFRGGADRRACSTDAVELVPSVPKMFGCYYPDAAAVLADPNGRVIITDGRNHLELTDERFDIIVTDPPPPIESSGAAVISSMEYYEAGRDHLTPTAGS